jgi:hypothetical protein
MSTITAHALAKHDANADTKQLSYKVIIDSGCTYFVTPHKYLFIPDSLQPTSQRMEGVEGDETTLLAEGFVTLHFKDPHLKVILHRFTIPALLSQQGVTLLSTKQLRSREGIGYHVPSDNNPSFLFSGNIVNPTHKLPLEQTDTGLDVLGPLTPTQLSTLVNSGYPTQDFTSSPTDSRQGNTRCKEILNYHTSLVFSEPQATHHGLSNTT